MEDKLLQVDLYSKGYGAIAKLVMQDRDIDIIAKAIYSYFCSFSGQGDCCFPTRNKICYDLQISKDTYSKYIKQLVDNGYLIVSQAKENGRFSHNVFKLPCIILPCPESTVSEIIGHGETDTNNNSINNNNNYNNNNIIKEKYKKEKIFAEEFETIWQEYPKKVGKDKSLKYYIKARQSGVEFEIILDGIKRYKKQIELQETQRQFIKDGSTWFNNACWQDEYITESDKPKEENNHAGYDLQKYKEMFGME